MTETRDLVFLFDVDNTLLNNDHVERDLRQYLSSCLSTQARDRFFEIFEELRQEIGYADYLGALQRYRREALRDPRVLRMSCWLVDYPFAQRLKVLEDENRQLKRLVADKELIIQTLNEILKKNF